MLKKENTETTDLTTKTLPKWSLLKKKKKKQIYSNNLGNNLWCVKGKELVFLFYKELLH